MPDTPIAFFDTDLEQKARQDARKVLEPLVGPSGPAVGFPTKPVVEMAPVPVNEQKGAAKAEQPDLTKEYAQMTGMMPSFPNQGQEIPFERSLLGRIIYPEWRARKMRELGFPEEAIGQPLPPPPAPTTAPMQIIPPQGNAGEGAITSDTIRNAIQSYAGFQPNITAIGAPRYQLTQAQANQLFNRPVASPAPVAQAPAPTVGWYQIEGQPKQYITDEFWKTPVPGGGSFNVIPGSAAGPSWVPPVSIKMGGEELKVPAQVLIDYAKSMPTQINPPEWTIPPPVESKMNELWKIIQAPVGTYSTSQRNAAAAMLNDLNRQVLEYNKDQLQTWQTALGYPLRERETAAHETSALAQAQSAAAQAMIAGPHAEYYRKMAQQGQLVPPGYAVFNPETRQKLFENAPKEENFAPYVRDAILAATEETPTGRLINPGMFLGYLNAIGKSIKGDKWQTLTFKDLDPSIVAPYIHRLIQANPKTANMKLGSDEYNEAFNATLRELYK